uniref:CCHC-type domain-containing protein n=1 Tax=Setaria italica TaxID=4555 RepID=K3Z0A5_SETIT
MVRLSPYASPLPDLCCDGAVPPRLSPSPTGGPSWEQVHDGLRAGEANPCTCTDPHLPPTRLDTEPWRLETWPHLVWRGDPSTPPNRHPSCSSTPTRLQPTVTPSTSAVAPTPKPNPVNPWCSLVGRPSPSPNPPGGIAWGADLGGFDRNLDHLWQRSESVGKFLKSNPPQPHQMDEGSSYGAQIPPRGGGRSGRDIGGHRREDAQKTEGRVNYGQWDDRRGNFRGGRYSNQHRRQRESERNLNQNFNRNHQFDLRNNLNQGREREYLSKTQEDGGDKEVQQQEAAKPPINKGIHDIEMIDNSGRRDQNLKREEDRMPDENKTNMGICKKCGKIGHRTKDCYKPLLCPRCKKEGHDMANCALITIKEGEVTARQVEGEFKVGPTSTWRWYAKKVVENKFQIKFPTARKVEELSFFTGMQMRMVLDVSFKVEQWNPHAGAKAEISLAWACYVGSLVGIPLEVDKINLKRLDYVRVRIGCKDVTKVPATVEALLDMHFYDFTFQREDSRQTIAHTSMSPPEGLDRSTYEAVYRDVSNMEATLRDGIVHMETKGL